MPPGFPQRPAPRSSWGIPNQSQPMNIRQTPQWNIPVRGFNQIRQSPFAMRRFQAPGRQGGILSRLFGRSGSSQIARPFNPFQFGGPQNFTGQPSVQNLLNPESIGRFLGQTQQVLRTAQQTIPLIQQYGPLIRNLPALWKLYQGFKNTDTENDNEEDETLNSDNIDEKKDFEQETEDNTADENGAHNQKKRKGKGKAKTNRIQIDEGEESEAGVSDTKPKKAKPSTRPSVPKLYI